MSDDELLNFNAVLIVHDWVRLVVSKYIVGTALVDMFRQGAPAYLIYGPIIVGCVFDTPRWRLK